LNAGLLCAQAQNHAPKAQQNQTGSGQAVLAFKPGAAPFSAKVRAVRG